MLPTEAVSLDLAKIHVLVFVRELLHLAVWLGCGDFVVQSGGPGFSQAQLKACRVFVYGRSLIGLERQPAS